MDRRVRPVELDPPPSGWVLAQEMRLHLEVAERPVELRHRNRAYRFGEEILPLVRRHIVLELHTGPLDGHAPQRLRSSLLGQDAQLLEETCFLDTAAMLDDLVISDSEELIRLDRHVFASRSDPSKGSLVRALQRAPHRHL